MQKFKVIYKLVSKFHFSSCIYIITPASHKTQKQILVLNNKFCRQHMMAQVGLTKTMNHYVHSLGLLLCMIFTTKVSNYYKFGWKNLKVLCHCRACSCQYVNKCSAQIYVTLHSTHTENIKLTSTGSSYYGGFLDMTIIRNLSLCVKMGSIRKQTAIQFRNTQACIIYSNTAFYYQNNAT